MPVTDRQAPEPLPTMVSCRGREGLLPLGSHFWFPLSCKGISFPASSFPQPHPTFPSMLLAPRIPGGSASIYVWCSFSSICCQGSCRLRCLPKESARKSLAEATNEGKAMWKAFPSLKRGPILQRWGVVLGWSKASFILKYHPPPLLIWLILQSTLEKWSHFAVKLWTLKS